MSLTEIKMPDVGEGVTVAEIVEWHVSEGDLIREDDVLAAIMTEKATIEVPAPCDGRIESLTGEIGDKVAVGSVIVTIETNGKSAPVPAIEEVTASNLSVAPAVAKIETALAPAMETPAAPPGHRVLASPAVRKLASETGTALAEVPSTGKDGRVTKGDLLAYLDRPNQTPVVAKTGSEFEEIKLVGLRRKIAERMQDASNRIAHFSYVEEIDVTELERLRKQLNEQNSDQAQRLTLLPFLMTAMTRAIEEFPHLNAHFDDGAEILRQYSPVHIGFATQTEKGLAVPVVRNVESLDLWQMASEIKQKSDATRDGTIGPEALTGSTITISSLGAMGGLAATPIINSPEVAIIGVNKIRTVPVWGPEGVTPRQVMNLSSSFDHRVIDGWDAASFIQAMKRMLENPATLFLKPNGA